MSERELEQLGIWRIPVPVPFPQAGGPVNVFLIEEEAGGLCLFDSGLGSEEARAALDAGFARLGRRYDEVRRIVVSHGHIDHFGNAQAIVEAAGGSVPVYGHADDREKLTESAQGRAARFGAYGNYLVRLGVPVEILASMAGDAGRGLKLARRVHEVRPIAEGELLRFRHFEARVLHMPGHTPGLVCLWDEEHGIFFADDHLLEKVSPNPLIELGPNGEEGFFAPLVAYMKSIARLRALDVELVLPGHGAPFGDHRRVIDDLVAFYGRRQSRIREELSSGPRTAHALTPALFPRMRPSDTFLVMSEMVANLEAMEERGEVAHDVSGGVYTFRLAS